MPLSHTSRNGLAQHQPRICLAYDVRGVDFQAFVCLEEDSLLAVRLLCMGLERRDQKVAIVTGATDGVGFELAKRLVCEGLRVIAVGRNADKGAE